MRGIGFQSALFIYYIRLSAKKTALSCGILISSPSGKRSQRYARTDVVHQLGSNA